MVPYKYDGVLNPFPETDHSKAFSVTGALAVFPVEFFELLQEEIITAIASNHLNLMG
jgi:hypothetical protein